MTPVQGAPVIALDVDKRIERVDGPEAGTEEPAVDREEFIGLVVADAEGRAGRSDGQIEAGGPSGCDRCATGNGETASQVVVLVANDEAGFMPVVPNVHGLDDPTRKGHRDLLVALADGRRFKLGHPLLEIRAAITAE